MRQLILVLVLVLTGTGIVVGQARVVGQHRAVGSVNDSTHERNGGQRFDRAAAIDRVLSAPVSRTASVRGPGLRLELRGIYALQGLLWFRLSVSNTSSVDFHALPVRVYIADRHSWRRRARQEIPLAIVARREGLLVASDSMIDLSYGVAPRLPGKRQMLVLEYAERGGPRHLMLRLGQKELLHAKKLENEGQRGFYRRDEQAVGPITSQ